MDSGWNLWVWLIYIGVASRCCCKEVYATALGSRIPPHAVLLQVNDNTPVKLKIIFAI